MVPQNELANRYTYRDITLTVAPTDLLLGHAVEPVHHALRHFAIGQRHVALPIHSVGRPIGLAFLAILTPFW